ncbi:opsin, ultraviolet-sensitive-like [Amphibalanus amphitrite]|uniref:opsin, ultraviolet-sensitive-like n=1 Tax=Amphibalanus amphitrite TaxID=1232801 RepID=UPI001C9160BA|nr:opsin, ultraviolet-sensitive-like [Amphibalanus amphitrite]
MDGLNESTLPTHLPLSSEVRMLGWNTPDDYLTHVNEHWLSFRAPDPVAHYVLGMLYIIFHIVSVLGNGSVLWIFLTTKELRTPSNLFIINLASMDFLMMLKTPIMIYNSFHQGPALGWVGCAVFATIGTISGAGSSCANALIAYDRYKKISDPMGVDFRMTCRRALCLIALMWVYISPWVVLPLLELFSRFTPEGFLTSCGIDFLSDAWDTRAYIAGIFLTMYVLPVLSIAVFYIRIFMHVSAHESTMRAQSAQMNVKSLRAGDDGDMRQELRVAKVGVMLTALYLFAWTPYAAVAFLGAFGGKAYVTPLVSMIPACTCKTAACLDPFAYAISHPAYRQALGRRLGCGQEAPTTASAVTASQKGVDDVVSTTPA